MKRAFPRQPLMRGSPFLMPGPYSGLWSSERISDMLQNETYIGNMVQGRSRKLSYKIQEVCSGKTRRIGWS